MNVRFLSAVTALGLAGCIIDGGGGNGGSNPGPSSGNITLSWTFAGKTCAQAGVANVHITIPGQTLQNDGVYPCTTAGYDGIVLEAFDPATYSFTINGLDPNGSVTYGGQGSATVDGDVSVPVDLASMVVQQGTAVALVSWTFPNGQNCSSAGVVTVDVSVDGATAISGQCAGGDVQTSPLASGTHSVSIAALDASGNQQYGATGTFTLQGTPASFSFPLQQFGGVDLSWTLVNKAGQTLSCGSAGLTALSIQLFDGQGAYFASPAPQIACSSVSGSLAVPPGTYTVAISGTDANGGSWTSSNSTAVTVEAGVFPSTPLSVSVVQQ